MVLRADIAMASHMRASKRARARYRGISRSRKIRMQLGGTANLLDPFPNKLRRMHWRTYQRLRARAAAGEGLSNAWLTRISRDSVALG